MYMLNALKRRLYFIVARYFRFWARLSLMRWHPKVIVITGSAGKTTLLHLVEAQLGDKAHYSHHANSAYGISFDILGLHGVTKSRTDWLKLIVKAPLRAVSFKHSEQFYVAEVDADRIHEAQFIAEFLKPAITMWVSSLHTHTIGFDHAVASGTFTSPEAAIAHEYGNIAARTTELVLYDADNKLVVEQVKRTKAQAIGVSQTDVTAYSLSRNSTTFITKEGIISFPGLVPQVLFTQLYMVEALMRELNLELDESYAKFVMPPGRSSMFEGKKDTVLIDSTYNNSNIDSMTGIINMFDVYPAKHKWLVLGDILEQGKDEAREHQDIAKTLNAITADRVLLFGKRLANHTVPLINNSKIGHLQVFEHPRDIRDYLLKELSGGEAILFKGAGFFEALIEALLENPADAKLLVRQEPLQRKRRQDFGL